MVDDEKETSKRPSCAQVKVIPRSSVNEIEIHVQ
jgi:hypothetical protein